MELNARIEYERETLLGRITELEREISRLDRELTSSNRLATLGILAGMIAHEFNNLLTPVMSYSQMAIRSPEDQDLVRKAMTRTLEGTERLAKVTDSILGFIRDDEQLQTSDVKTVVEESLACLVRQPEKNGITVVRTIPSGLRASIRPVALQQVLLNLLVNAVRSMEKRGGELRIDAGLQDLRDEGTAVISVSDTGPGIDPLIINRVFEPFVSEDQTNSKQMRANAQSTCRAGVGLGLAVCRRLIEEAGGEITVCNRTTGGACFTIRLPVGTVDPA